jgi:peptidoglycan/LPS O-acetylase OafA/YrhL
VGPLTHPKYRPDLDGLRAFAVLSVVGYHSLPVLSRGGFIGVDCFFVISGFLISTILFENLERGTFSFSTFYLRRVRRIFPALLVTLAACLGAGALLLFSQELAALGTHVAAGAGFVSNLLLWSESGYFDRASAEKPLLHLWSLGIEEQFYLLWPLLLWLAARRRQGLLWVTALVGAASFALNLWGVGRDQAATFYSPLTRFWELLVGAALAHHTLHRKPGSPALLRLGDEQRSLAGAALLLLSLFAINGSRAFPGLWALLPTAGTALLISAGPDAFLNRRVLSHRLLVWFGLISFPLYLWHWPLLSLAHVVEGGTPPRPVRLALVAAAVVLAWLTYRFVERPLRQGAGGNKSAAALLVGVAALGCFGLYTARRGGFPGRAVEANNPARGGAPVFLSNPLAPCTFVRSPLLRQYCDSWPAPAAKRTIALWGDSSTEAWQPVFQDLAREHGFTLVNFSFPSCPPLLESRKTAHIHRESPAYCTDGKVQAQVVEELRALRPDLIVLIASWGHYSPASHRELLTDRPGEEATPATTARTLRQRVPETLAALEAFSPVLVFRSWPILPRELRSGLTLAQKLRREPDPRTFAAEVFREERALIDEVLDGAALPGTRYFEPAAGLCEGRCSTYSQGIKMYADEYHQTQRGVLTFRGQLEALVVR